MTLMIKGCWCRVCERPNTRMFSSSYRMSCPNCGRKDCPKAAYHGHSCTMRNDPDQVGSVYSRRAAVLGRIYKRYEGDWRWEYGSCVTSFRTFEEAVLCFEKNRKYLAELQGR